jgi:protein ImuB
MKGSDSAKAKSQSPTSNLQAPNASPAQSSDHSTFNKGQSGSDQHSTAEILRILHKWGIHTLGQLAALNKEELRTRLGPEAVRLWERATGTATRLLKFVQPPETFDESFEFDHEIETAEPSLFILRRFLEQLALRLSSIYLVARELTLTITFSKSEPDWHFTKTGAAARTYERTFKIPQPTNDIDLLFRMLQTHLENFKSEYPIVAVALSAEPSRPASQQFGLFETALRNPHQLYETLARLTALVGNDRVGTPVIEETHRPDAFRMEPFCWNNGGKASVPSNLSDTTERVPLRAIENASPARTRQNKHAADTAAATPKIALRRFRPPARTSIFISEYQHLESDKVRGQIIDQTGPFFL